MTWRATSGRPSDTASVDTTNDFNWQMQLRYYWNEEDDTCLIRQTNSSFNYAYEYLGGAVLVETS